MNRLYTTLLYAGTAPTGAMVYAVPAGYRVVVTDFFFASNADDGTYAQLADSVGATIAGGDTNPPGPDQYYVIWHGRQAMNVGDTITVETDASEPTWRITGWLLALP